MKQLSYFKICALVSVLAVLAPGVSMAQPAQPGDGQDPFATPVNGYIAIVAIAAFIYGAYRIYQLSKSNSIDNNNL